MIRRNKTSGIRIKRLRARLSEAQNHRCAYCGKDIWGCGTFDHIKPRCQGGTECLQNGVAACHDCNKERGDRDAFHFFRIKQHELRAT